MSPFRPLIPDVPDVPEDPDDPEVVIKFHPVDPGGEGSGSLTTAIYVLPPATTTSLS